MTDDIREKAEALVKLRIIPDFATSILKNIEDLDPEFSKMIDEDYWDLI